MASRATRAVAFICCVMAAVHAWAQPAAWPARPVRGIVPFPPGGSTMKTVVRMLTQDIPKALGRQVIVENRPGTLIERSLKS